uniref:Uncharacterized protein n=1 Tax=Acrobeloides nanus TaxID=290746 RepID=A0A914CJ03_9BILA
MLAPQITLDAGTHHPKHTWLNTNFTTMFPFISFMLIISYSNTCVYAAIYRGPQQPFQEPQYQNPSSLWNFMPVMSAFAGFQHGIEPIDFQTDSRNPNSFPKPFDKAHTFRHHSNEWGISPWMPFMPPPFPPSSMQSWYMQWPWKLQGIMCPIEDLKIDGRVVEKIVHIINLLNLTQSDYEALQDGLRSWNFNMVRNTIFSLIMTRLQEDLRNEALTLLDNYGPPSSLVDALAAFTLEQKGQVEMLANANRSKDLETIMKGVITSIPDDDQPQAKKFVAVMKYLFGGL